MKDNVILFPNPPDQIPEKANELLKELLECGFALATVVGADQASTLIKMQADAILQFADEGGAA